MPKGVLGGIAPDPEKGRPYRHLRARIRLLLADVADDPLALEQLVLKIAEKRPEDVLDALTWLTEELEEGT